MGGGRRSRDRRCAVLRARDAATGSRKREQEQDNSACLHRLRFSECGDYPCGVSVIGLVLLAAAIALLVFAEWPRLRTRTGLPIRAPREKKRHLRGVEPDSDPDPDEFQRAVERDLANLPTYDPRAPRD